MKQQVVHEAKKSKKLKEAQVKQLESAARENAYTGCGKSWEEEALYVPSQTHHCSSNSLYLMVDLFRVPGIYIVTRLAGKLQSEIPESFPGHSSE